MDFLEMDLLLEIEKYDTVVSEVQTENPTITV